MRIFFITSEFIDAKTRKVVDGGLANYLYKITRELAKNGHDIHVVLPYQKGERNILFEGNVHVHFLKPPKNIKYHLKKLAGKLASQNFQQFKKDYVAGALYKFLEAEHLKKPIDIVQLASLIPWAPLPANIPYCVRISSYAKLYVNAYGYKDDAKVEDESILFRKSRFVFGPAQHINEYICKDLSLPHKFEVIETPCPDDWPIEDESVYLSLRERIQSAPYLLFFGTIGRLKGSDEIAEIIHQFLERYKEIYFVLAGRKMTWGGAGYCYDGVEHIKASAKEHAGRVIHIPPQPHTSLYPLIRNAKAIVLPSRIDNFPNACVEAMRLKKAVLGTRGAGGFEQLLDDGHSGFLAAAENSPSLLEALNRLMQTSDEQLRVIGENAYVRTQALAPDIIVKKLLDYYRYVIQNRE